MLKLKKLKHMKKLLKYLKNIRNYLWSMTTNPPKQVKQRYYYIFWSIATIAVVAGQIYIASSYRLLADALRQNLL